MKKQSAAKKKTILGWLQNNPLSRFVAGHRYFLLVIASVLLAAGIIARFSLIGRGHNFDFDSWVIVGDIVKNNDNVYNETFRYNYGPVWFTILGFLRSAAEALSSSPDLLYRYFIIATLTVIDIGLWLVLKKYFGYVVAFIFFLNPISIIITGYHHQFDNLAILLALIGIAIFGKVSSRITRRHYLGLLFLGFSLVTKHIFFTFPLWMAIRQPGLKQKALVLALPLTVFALCFLPFWGTGSEGIIKNVFLYKSFNNAPFWYMMVPSFLQGILTPQVLFYGSLLLFGFICRKRPLLESVLMYTLILVVFSPAIANQYLAIVLPAVAAFFNIFFAVYMVYASLFLAISEAGLHSSSLVQKMPNKIISPINQNFIRTYDFLIVVLALGLFWQLWGEKILRTGYLLVQWIKQEIKFQVRSD